MNPKQLMKQVQQMQEQMQQKMTALRVEGSAGGGMVKAAMNGSKELLGITIDKEAVDPNDIEMLQDLVVAAVNEASRKVDEEMASSVGAMTGGMKIPGMGF
jgi:DNA-binding YbaB/EbfC family protein